MIKRKYNNILLLVGVLILMNSCSSPKEVKPSFEKQIELTFTSLGVEELFFKPLCLEVFDSLLLVCDPTKEGVYTLLNLKTNEIVCKGAKIGNGPDDLISTCILDKIENDKFQVIDVSNRKILFFSISDIVKTKAFVPYDNVSYTAMGKDSEHLQICYQITDSTYVGLGQLEKEKYLVSKKQQSKTYGEYPSLRSGKVNPYWIHQGVLHIARNQKMLLYHSPFGYYFELMKFDDEKMTLLFTDYFPHSYKEMGNECLITDETPCGINNAEITDDGVFLLYSGRTMKDSPKMAFYCRSILFLNLKGEHKIEYKLDRDVSMMALDNSKRKIYVISVNPETYEMELGYYKY